MPPHEEGPWDCQGRGREKQGAMLPDPDHGLHTTGLGRWPRGLQLWRPQQSTVPLL